MSKRGDSAVAEEHGPVKKVMVSALIVVIIVAVMVGVMLVGEVIYRWL